MSTHEATGLLKLFFSLLSDSLFTSSLHRSFIAAGQLTSKKEQMDTLRLNFTLLPQANRDLAISLMEFCNEVVLYESSNKMDMHNLSVIFGPTLFSKKKSWTQVKEKFFNMRGAGLWIALISLFIFVVADISLPKNSGYEVARKAAARARHPPPFAADHDHLILRPHLDDLPGPPRSQRCVPPAVR